MGAKNARLRRKCAKKITYSTFQSANNSAFHISKNKHARLFGYKCPTCYSYHVGHRKRWL